MASHEVTCLWRFLAALLHLNCIEFESEVGNVKNGGAVVAYNDNFASKTALERAARLLGCEPSVVEEFLTTNEIHSAYLAHEPGDGTVLRTKVTAGQAVFYQQALTKALYANLFAWVAKKVSALINSPTQDGTKAMLPPSSPEHDIGGMVTPQPVDVLSAHHFTVGVMDSIGIEKLQRNGLEHFLILCESGLYVYHPQIW